MILYYTGADKGSYPQTFSNKSLGGYISSSVLPNGGLDNLFEKVGKSDIRQRRISVRCIALKNFFPDTKQNFKIYSELGENSLCTLKIAVVQPSIDPVGNFPYFEQIGDSESLPYYSDFQTYEGEANALIVPELLPQSYVGIWIMREFKESTVQNMEPSNQQVIDAFEDNGDKTPVSVDVETIKLVIDF